MKGNKIICLFLAALIWGFAFVAQSVGMDYIGPFTFNGIRCFIGGLVLIPVAWICVKKEPKEQYHRKEDADGSGRKVILAGGLTCGGLMFVAASLQQIGIQYTQAGKAGFLTAMYVVLVPVISIFIGKKVHKKIWLCVALCVAGMYLLCMSGGVTALGKGDVLVILCAIGFAIHILAVDYFVERMNGVLLSCLQFLISGAIGLIFMVIFEEPNLEAILNAKTAILYAAILSCGGGYTLQIIGQKGTNPTVASLILSLESVFSVIGGWLILHQVLSVREIMGCVIIFVAIVIAQIPLEKFFGKKGSA